MKRKILSIILATTIVCSLSGCMGITVVPKGEATEEENGNDIAAMWEKQVIPEVKKNAVELSELLKEANGNLKELGEKYGHYSNGSSGNLNFAVHITGTVEAVNVEKKAGYITVKPDGCDETVQVLIQIGNVFKGTTIRDYLSFINVNDYQNQIEYAQLAKDFNSYIGENVIDYEATSGAQGKKVDLYGCFTYDNDEELLVTPVELEIS